jgi:soluble lytic murein transglycosylase
MAGRFPQRDSARLAAGSRGRATAAALLLAASLGAMAVGGALAEGLRTALPAKSAGLLFTASGENAVKAALAGRYDEAGQAAAASGNKAAQRIVEWFYIRDAFRNAGYQRIMNFLAENPGWPGGDAFMARAEILLYESGSPGAIAAHFANRQPVSPEGHAALARLLLSQGDKKGAAQQVRAAWTSKALRPDSEKRIASEFAALLGGDDHQARLWTMVVTHEPEQALRASSYLPREYRSAALAAKALIAREPGGENLYKQLPRAIQQAPAMRYVLARWYHLARKNYLASRDILLAAPNSPAAQLDPEQWCDLKQSVARYLLADNFKDYRNAYKLASQHGLSSGKIFEESEFLAGFIALTRLNEPKLAAKHFRRLAEKASSRTETARGKFWLGRALEAMGDKAGANAAYGEAAAYPTLFYGQLAIGVLGRGEGVGQISRFRFNDADVEAVRADPMMGGMLLMAKAGGENQLGPFLEPLALRLKDGPQLSAAASLLAKATEPYFAMRFAKATGTLRGIDIDDYGFPIDAMPRWRSIGAPVERAVVYGLTRQESEFQPLVKSHAGARGLMQLMPRTAQLVARRYGVNTHNTDKLINDPAHNVALGEAHLGELLEVYRGSYLLTFAAYNAGPGRVRQWIDMFGDPRDPAVDPVDFVESIPVTETRRYVQRVMQNVQVYRSRLKDAARSLRSDLERGRGSGGAKEAMDLSSHNGGCSRGASTIASLLSSC